MVNLTLRPLLADQEIGCDYCKGEEGSVIGKGEEFICLDGFRKYEKMGRIERKKAFVPYIPDVVLRRLPMAKRVPEEFKHYLTKRTICKKCLAKFCLVVSIKTPSVMKTGRVYEIDFRHTKRHFTSNLDYVCLGCRKEIKPRDHYVRFGMYRDCCCPPCVSQFEGILGTEYTS